jgi:hypothetical protein
MPKQNHPGYHRHKRTVRQTRLSIDVLESIASFNVFGQRADAALIGDEYRPHRSAPNDPLIAEPFSEMPPVGLVERRFPDRQDEIDPPNAGNDL